MKTVLLSLYALLLSLQVYTQGIVLGQGGKGIVSTRTSDAASEPDRTVDNSGVDAELQAASRFLARATLGATMEDIRDVSSAGIESWIDRQLTLPPSNYAGKTIDIAEFLYQECVDNFGAEGCRMAFNLNKTMFRYAWWDNAINGEDKLRQRLALALSEILVISDESQLNSFPHGVAYYYDLLMTHAFGNFHDLLLDVTLNPCMGFYLSHINNPRTFEELNIHPDENYAREIMQLFTIGLYELNNDGTRKLDSDGLWIPTYDNDDIKELAKIFTGLSGSQWADPTDQRPVQFGRNFGRYSLLHPMAMYEDWHEPGPKTILGDVVIDERSGMDDVEAAVWHLFNHDNVPPFISSQLIQRLVKSNPSPEYVERVANVFIDNGQGIRGDLRAVVKAILLDEEALDCYWFGDERNGQLKPPVHRLTQMLIGLEARTRNGTFWHPGIVYHDFTDQHPMSSPTVFNFYRPDYVPDSDFAYAQMSGPEFQILNSSTSSNYINYMLIALMGDYLDGRYGIRLPDLINESFLIPFVDDQESYKAELSNELWMDLGFEPDDLVDYLDLLLANGMLSDHTRNAIVESIEPDNLLTPTDKSSYALFMLMIHPDYLIMK